MAKATIALVKTLFDALNEQDLHALYACIQSDYEDANVTLESSFSGRSAVKDALISLYAAFPDARFRTHRMTCEWAGTAIPDSNRQAVVFWSFRATHLGTFHRIPSTGLSVATAGSSVFEIQDGRIARGLHVWDMGGLLRSMRLLPNPGRTPPGASGDRLSAFFSAPT